jgi:transposase-like protein
MVLKCPHCNSRYVHRSRLRVYDLVLLLLFLRPYRCEDCDRRFYGFIMPRRGP